MLYFKNGGTKENTAKDNLGLTHNINGDELVQDLVNKDTDRDGVLDWEENLWGTDPNNKDTNGLGLGDKAEIERIKSQNIIDSDDIETGGSKLTETDKFAQELFATVTALNQTGQMDEITVEKITGSLAERIQNAVPKKIYGVTQIKTINDNTDKAINAYGDALNSLYKKYPVSGNVMTIFQKMSTEEELVDENVLLELDPIIKNTSLFVEGMTKINTPTSIMLEHLEVLNSLQRIVENLNDVKLMNKDIIVALTGISQYEENSTYLETALVNLAEKIDKELSN